MSELTFAQVVGQPGDGVWSQVWVGRNIKAGVASRMQQFDEVVVAVMQIRNGEELVVEKGEGWLRKLDGWLEQGGLFEQLSEMVRNDSHLSEIVVVKIGGQQLWVWGKGASRVMMARKGKVGLIFSGTKDQLRQVTGTWKHCDRLLVGTSGLIDEMSAILVEEVMGLEVDVAGDELATRVQATEDSSMAAGLIVQLYESGQVEVYETEIEAKTEQLNEAEGKSPTVYLRRTNVRRKKTILVGLAILGVLVVSVVLGWWKREQMRFERIVISTQEQVEMKLGQAQAVAEDNPLKAKALAEEARQVVLVSVEALEGKEEYIEQVKTLETTIAEVYRQVSGEMALAEVEVWFDLNLVKEGMSATRMAVDGTTVLVMDATLGLLASIDADSKEASLSGGGEMLSGMKLVDVNGNRGLTLAQAGLVEVDLQRKTSALLKAAEPEWQRITGVAWYGGNVYMLDAGANEIWLYPALSQGLGERQRWLKGGEQQLTEEIDMAIDGDIWTVDAKGVVDRYRRGVEERFEIQGLLEPVQEAIAVEVPDESEWVYILDRGGKRVLVMNKETGVYERQILWQGLGAVTDIVVVEELQLVLALSSQQIYGLPLL